MTPIAQAVRQALKPHYDNQGEVARLAYLYGRLPFAFVEAKLRFEQMTLKMGKRINTEDAEVERVNNEVSERIRATAQELSDMIDSGAKKIAKKLYELNQADREVSERLHSSKQKTKVLQ